MFHTVHQIWVRFFFRSGRILGTPRYWGYNYFSYSIFLRLYIDKDIAHVNGSTQNPTKFSILTNDILFPFHSRWPCSPSLPRTKYSFLVDIAGVTICFLTVFSYYFITDKDMAHIMAAPKFPSNLVFSQIVSCFLFIPTLHLTKRFSRIPSFFLFFPLLV